jgi:hypothetical protein
MEVDIGTICEHKVDLTTPKTLNRLKEGATRHFGMGAFRIKAASTPIQHGRDYKPGGVLGVAIGPVAGRMIHSYHDEIGRWVSFTFRRRETDPLTVICTYQVIDVNPKSDNVGPETYATQLHAHYNTEGRENPEKLRHHHSMDLVQFVKERQSKGEVAAILGDFNEVLGENLSGMTIYIYIIEIANGLSPAV